MILMLTQCFPPVRGGIENLMAGLAGALTAAGHIPMVLADHGGDSRRQPDRFDFPVRRFGGPKKWRRWRKAQQVRALPVTAILADSWKSLQVLPRVDVPVIVLAHGMEFPQNAKPSKRARIRRALAKATVVVANSAYTAALAQPYLEGLGIPLEIIYPPIHPQPEAGPLPEGLTGSPLLVTLARLEPRKGVDQVIRAMPALLQQFPNAVYVVAGGGDDRPRLEALVAALGVADAVRFTGMVDASMKAALYAHADLYAMPTRRDGNSVEGFGIGYVEAAWYGVPSLAGKDGGAPDAVLDGQTGLVCDGADAAAVEQALLQLLGDEPLRQRLGAAAKERAHTELQWAQALPRYLALMQLNRRAD